MDHAPRPLKRPTTTTEQILLLRSRGMDVDEALARQWLPHVGYYRLSAYWYPAKARDASERRTDKFDAPITFHHVAALYEADRKLRTLVHDGMERIEVAVRAHVGDLLCSTDALAYRDPSRFRDSFKHAAWLETAKKRAIRARKHNEAIRHHDNEYGGQYPFWVLADVLDFADVSRLFEGLPTKDQRHVAEGLGVTLALDRLSKSQQNKAKKHSPLARWLEQLTIVRNICAHHGRLWNRSLMPAPTPAASDVYKRQGLSSASCPSGRVSACSAR